MSPAAVHAFDDELARLKQRIGRDEYGIAHQVLLKYSKMSSKAFREAIQTMQDRHDIVAEQRSTSGRPAIFYRVNGQ